MSKKISYVEFERRILVNLVEKYRDIVECKKTDSSTVFKKQQTWIRITNEYNKHFNVRKRQNKQLKRLWENTKAKAKKNITSPLSTVTQPAPSNHLLSSVPSTSTAFCQYDLTFFRQLFVLLTFFFF